MERHSISLQPRLCRARTAQPGHRLALVDHFLLAAGPRLRDRRLVVQLDRMGDRRRVQGPDRAPRFLQRTVFQTHARDRVGRIAGRDHHRRAGPALPGPIRRRYPDLRRARRRRCHLEHGARRRVRVQRAAGASRAAVRESGWHHQPAGQPGGRAADLQRGCGLAGGSGPDRADRRAQRLAGLG